MAVNRISRTRKPAAEKFNELSFVVDMEFGGEGVEAQAAREHLTQLIRYASAARVWKGPGGVDFKSFIVYRRKKDN